MFRGAVWVLTPRPTTPDTTFTAVASIVAELGAEVVAVPADAHDALVAVVSHVPHLTAATLMTGWAFRARRVSSRSMRGLPSVVAGTGEEAEGLLALNRLLLW